MTLTDDAGNVLLKVPTSREVDRFIETFAWASDIDMPTLAGMAVKLGVERMRADLVDWDLPQPETLCGR